MSGMQNVSFGSLTAKTYNIDFKDLKPEDLDIDKDGVLSEEELNLAVQNGEVDVVDLSTTDKDADQKVTQEQYDLWQQEAEMNEFMSTMKTRAARELVGQTPDDIKKLLDKLTDFEDSFKESYLKTHANPEGMSQDFMSQLSKKYVEFKKDVLSNTKTAVVSRVVKNVIQNFVDEDKQKGGEFLKLIDSDASTLSENAKRLLSNELTREAEKFIKKYDGKTLESDLEVYLQKYLSQTDKETLADTIGVWEKGKKSLENVSEEVRFMKLKAMAKNLMLEALENNIYLKIGEMTVRSDSIIPAVLGQFKDVDSLSYAVDKAISELSSKTRAEEIKEQDQERKSAVEQEEKEQKIPEENSKNIFS